MDFHTVCKSSRRDSNPDVLNCSNPTGTPQQQQQQKQQQQQQQQQQKSQGVTPSTGDAQNRCAPFSLSICPTTGGLVQLDIPANETVDGLRRAVSKKLGVAQDRISLLYREKLLRGGSLIDNQLSDGCRITLLPKVESGLMPRQPELSVMQALENLSDSQVNDFLSGRSPLTLAMRLGNHMMFLQLQLSSVSHGNKRAHGHTSTSANPARGRHPYRPTPPAPRTMDKPRGELPRMGTSSSIPTNVSYGRLAPPPSIITPPPSPKSPSIPNTTQTPSSPYTYPVTSLPVNSLSPTSKDVTVDPANTPPPSPCYVQKPPMSLGHTNSDAKVAHSSSSTTSTSSTHLRVNQRATVCGNQWNIAHDNQKNKQKTGVPFLDKSTLAEAKRSLSMKLKEFSEQATQEIPKEVPAPGAVIESMQRLGHGVYSGTFSGTLNPALQDPDGKPRRSINTIVHILNDLIGASPTRAAAVAAAAQAGQAQAERHGATAATGLDPGVESHPDGKCFQQQCETVEDAESIRGKVEQIQLMLEERRRKRQARRDARSAPYSSRRPSGNSETSRDSISNDMEELEQEQPIQFQKGFD